MKQENGSPPIRAARRDAQDGAYTPELDGPCFRRRALLKRMGLLGVVSLGLSLGVAKPASAKAAKGDFMYQEHPKDGKDCAQCKFFTPADEQAQSGNCAIVSGVIDGSGWCLAYSPRA